jgi:hypothetical protein
MATVLSRIPAFLCIAVSLCVALPRMAAADDVLGSSPLHSLIVDYIKAHPDATLAEVAAFANARLPENGVDYELAIYDRVPPDRTVVFEAGARRLLSRTPEEVDIGPCGEFWVTVPALRAGPDSLDLVHKAERLTVPRPAGLENESMTFYSADQKTALSRIDVPWSAFPRGVLQDGSGVIIDFGLGDEAAAWWQHVRAANPQITPPDYSHLLLRVGADGLRFIDDASRYGDEPVESIADFPNPSNDSYRHRDRFPNSGLVVEYESPCT